ncbi:Uncharacterised protein [Mycobacterium tuberculosis]|nr:Uncharacterised protein [Mycobacterium tuberculosis]
MTAPSWPPSAQPADASTNTVHTPATRLALRGLNPVSLDVNAPSVAEPRLPLPAHRWPLRRRTR